MNWREVRIKAGIVNIQHWVLSEGKKELIMLWRHESGWGYQVREYNSGHGGWVGNSRSLSAELTLEEAQAVALALCRMGG